MRNGPKLLKKSRNLMVPKYRNKMLNYEMRKFSMPNMVGTSIRPCQNSFASDYFPVAEKKTDEMQATIVSGEIQNIIDRISKKR